jgi:hypothetical protein
MADQSAGVGGFVLAPCASTVHDATARTAAISSALLRLFLMSSCVLEKMTDPIYRKFTLGSD